MLLREERLQQGHPVLYARAKAFHKDLERLGYDILVVRVWSTASEQQKKFEQGRTYDAERGLWLISDSRQVITYAKPGRSAHNLVMREGLAPAAVAEDIIPLDANRTPLWGLPGETKESLKQRWLDRYGKTPDQGWKEIFEAAWSCLLDPLGDKKGAYLPGDDGHFEIPDYKKKMGELGVVYQEYVPVKRI